APRPPPSPHWEFSRGCGGTSASRSPRISTVNRLLKIAALAAVGLLGACTGVPEGLTPVKDFDGERYLGTWYEIARLDHSFERGLSKVSATYSRREDGGIRVLNRGFNSAEGEWSEAEGRAYFTQGPEVGALKVS